MDVSLPAHAAAPWLAPAVWLVARGTVLLVLALLLTLALRRASAATRHLAWALALSGMLALPALTLAAPRWELPWVHVVPLDAPAALPAGLPGAGDAGLPWGTLILALWAVGALATLGRYGVALLAVRRIAQGAHPLAEGLWMDRVRAAGEALGMREPVRLLQAADAAMPMTWGILRPVVLVPAEADGWTAERARVVLLHELAHVARRDCLWQTVARLACAAYWFHPGVWWAARRMHVEREQACDDQVLAAGTRPSDYAGHLLDVARAFRARPVTAAAAVAMARRSQLEGRVVAVLDAARARGRVPARVALLAGGVASVALFPLAAASPDGFEPPPAALPAVQVVAAAPAPRAEADVVPSVAAVDAPVAAVARVPSARAPRAAPAAPAPQPGPVARAPYPEPFPELEMGDIATLDALLRASRDADPDVRRSAVWALGRMDGGVVVGSLVRSMNDSDARVRSAAALALGEYAERQDAPRARRGGRDSLRAPGGTAAAAGPPPLAGRSDIGGAPIDPGLRILQGLPASDSASPRGFHE